MQKLHLISNPAFQSIVKSKLYRFKFSSNFLHIWSANNQYIGIFIPSITSIDSNPTVVQLNCGNSCITIWRNFSNAHICIM
jgi:hypothetical protein